jgi:hypothetical protein
MARRTTPAVSYLLALGFAALSCASSGCRSDPYKLGKRAPVRGRITVDGAPLRTGIVTFHPDVSRGNTSPHQPSANIDKDGNYALFTVGEAQAPLGWYKVVVLAYERDDDVKGKRPDEPKRLVAAAYEDMKTTPLSREVIEGAPPGTYDLQLSP